MYVRMYKSSLKDIHQDINTDGLMGVFLSFFDDLYFQLLP